MDPLDTLQTARLVGARPGPDDVAALRRLHADPRVMATLAADGRPLPEEATRRTLQRELDHWARHGYGAWYFREREGGDFVGYCGLHHTAVAGRDEVELLYATLAECWGRGLTTEMAGAVLATGFGRLGLAEVVAFTLPHNRASRRVMEKRGFAYEGDIVHAGLPHVLYRLTAEQWRAAGGEGGSAR